MSSKKQKWQDFLSPIRIGEQHSVDYDNFRSPYQRDKDAITFSDYFRKLQGKTQVFSLTRNDYIRNRLTHSFEVASVGRSLAEIVGKQIIERHSLDISLHDFYVITEAACLAHDIGHPPLAHSGEEAFREFFSKRQCDLKPYIGESYQDFIQYEGNAQNIRILTDLQQPSRDGGMRLTSAVLGAITKYPRLSHYNDGISTSWATRKFNFFQRDKHVLDSLAQTLNLPSTFRGNEYRRSPLAYLVEASDDICYSLVDIEDSYIMKVIDYPTTVQLLSAITGNTIEKGKLSELEHIQRLRAKAIGRVVNEVSQVFLDYEEDILEGKFNGDLLDYISVCEEFRKLTNFAADNVYISSVALEVRTAGYNVIDKILELLVDCAMDRFNNKENLSSKSHIYLHYMPSLYRNRILNAKTAYEAIISVTDYVSSMTDKEAIMVYQNFLGASIPSN